MRFVLGLIAGIVLSSLVPIESGADGGGSFTRPFLALLGGFSAAVVFRILERVVGTLESLVRGDGSDGDGIRKRLATTEASQQRTHDQMRVGALLFKLREQLAAGAPYEELIASIDGLLDDMLPVDIDDAGGSLRDPELRRNSPDAPDSRP